MPKQIIFVRHGETPYNSKNNKSNRMMGWNDHEHLSEQGKLDAKITADKLKDYHLDFVYHSDFIRTSETSAIITEQLGLISTPTHGLRERNLGNFADHTFHEIMTERPADFAKFLDHADADWNGLEGESLRDVYNRFHSFMQELSTKHSDKNVLLVTHSGIIHTVLRDYFNLFPKESFIEVGHSSVTVLEKVDHKYHLVAHNI